MIKSMDDEFKFDPRKETSYQKRDEYSYAEEYDEPDGEDAKLPDETVTAPEYNGRSAALNADEDKGGNKRRAIIKKIMFMLVAASAAALSVVFAANSLDPLGADFLMTGLLAPTSSMPTTPTTPTTPTSPSGYTDTFPALPNLDPDFAGNYAWSGFGSEEYVCIDGDYLCAGTVYTDSGTPIVTVAGASYDKTTNTLTLNNFKGTRIDTNLMGNGFKIELIGENSVEFLRLWGAMYGGSVIFTGTGSIKINEKQTNTVGLMLECEDSQSCIMIDREATVEVFGEKAIVVHRTTLEEAIFALQPVKISGGAVSRGEFVEYTVNVTDDNGVPLKDENGDYITEIWTVKDISKAQGLTLYDVSVVDEDGKPSTHVIFKPEE